MVEPRSARTHRSIHRRLLPVVSVTVSVKARSFEAFKQLHLGLISEVKRKSLPAIAQVAG